MISAGICTRCENCKGINPSETSESGWVSRPLSIDCEIGGLLLQSSCVPVECSMKMEHLLCEEDTRDAVELLSFANTWDMKGGTNEF